METPDPWTEAITNARMVLTSPISDDDETPIESDVAIVDAWVRETLRHTDGDARQARNHISGRLQLMGAPDMMACVMAAIMVDHVENAPNKCKHCGKEIVWRDRLSVGKDNEGWYWPLGDDYCEAPGVSYHEPA
jgi:hypothetical protein